MLKPRLMLVCVALAAGCGQAAELPKVYPAAGKVQFVGGRPFAGGLITFTSTTDPRLVMDAPIGDDGTFRLGTVAANTRLDGAVAGVYSVMVSSRFTPGTAVAVYQLTSTMTIEPKENTLTVEVDPATARK